MSRQMKPFLVSCCHKKESCTNFGGLKWGIVFLPRSETGYGKSQILVWNSGQVSRVWAAHPHRLLCGITPPPPLGRDTGINFRLFLYGFCGRVWYVYLLPFYCCVMQICVTYKDTQLTSQSQCRMYVTHWSNNCRFKHWAWFFTFRMTLSRHRVP